MIGLGDRVKEKITGFTGIVTCKAKYLTGCDRCIVSAEKLDKNADNLTEFWFDEPMLTVVKKGAKSIKVTNKTDGGPKHHKVNR
jgi:hypothetical protein